MTYAERTAELKQLRARVQAGELRSDIRERRNLLSAITPLLNFNEVYYSNALQVVDILSRPGFSSNAYDHSEGRLDVLMGQAITELEHSLTPQPAAEPPPFTLTSDHGPLWFWSHCTWRVRWLTAGVLGVVFGVGFSAGRIDFFVKVYELWTDAK